MKCIHTDYNVGIEIGESIEFNISYIPKKVGAQKEKLVLLTTEVDNYIYEVEIVTETVETLIDPKGIMHQNTPTGFGF